MHVKLASKGKNCTNQTRIGRAKHTRHVGWCGQLRARFSVGDACGTRLYLITSSNTTIPNSHP